MEQTSIEVASGVFGTSSLTYLGFPSILRAAQPVFTEFASLHLEKISSSTMWLMVS